LKICNAFLRSKANETKGLATGFAKRPSLLRRNGDFGFCFAKDAFQPAIFFKRE
jgi:hypothetical protein